MNKLNLFANFHTILEKHVPSDVSDIIEIIYKHYDSRYENYTLLELIKFMQKNKYKEFPLNKKEIITIIKDENLPLPDKGEELKPSKWNYFRFTVSIDNGISFCDTNFVTHKGDIYKMSDGKIYTIYDIWSKYEYNDTMNCYLENYITLTDIETGSEKDILTQEFIRILDEEDITILYNIAAYIPL